MKNTHRLWVIIFWCMTLHAAEPQPVSQTQVRRQAIRAMLLPFLYNDVIPLVLGYQENWVDCMRNGDYHWLTQPVDTEKDQKKRAAAEQAWLQQLGYDYEDAEAIRSRIPALVSAWSLRRHGKIEGFVDKAGKVYFRNNEQSFVASATIPYSCPVGYEQTSAQFERTIDEVRLSDCGKRIAVKNEYRDPKGIYDSSRSNDTYQLDWHKRTLTKDGFSCAGYQDVVAVASKREVVDISLIGRMTVSADGREIFRSNVHPRHVSFMGNNVLVVVPYIFNSLGGLIFYDTSRSVPDGYNRSSENLAIPSSGEGYLVQDLSTSYETGRIFVRMKNYETNEVTTKVLQLGSKLAAE